MAENEKLEQTGQAGSDKADKAKKDKKPEKKSKPEPRKIPGKQTLQGDKRGFHQATISEGRIKP